MHQEKNFTDVLISLHDIDSESDSVNLSCSELLISKFRQTISERLKLNESIYEHMKQLIELHGVNKCIPFVRENPFPDNDCTLAFFKILSYCGLLLEFASERIRNDETLALIAVQNDVDALMDVSINLRENRDFALKVVQLDISNSYKKSTMKYLNKFKDDYEIVLKAVRQCGISLANTAIRLRYDKQIIEEAVKSCGTALSYVPKDFIDRNLVMSAISSDAKALQYALNFKNDKEVVFAAFQVGKDSFHFASDELKSDREFCMKLVKLNGHTIRFCSDELKNDKEMAIIAVKSDPYSYYCLPPNMKNDREILLKCASIALFDLPYDISSDREFMNSLLISGKQLLNFLEYSALTRDFELELIGSNCNYQYGLFGRIKEEEELFTRIVNIDPSAFMFATSDNIRNNKQIVMNALFYEAEILGNISEELKNDRELFELAIRLHDNVLYYASMNLRNDKDLVMMSIEYDAFSFQYASEELKNDRQVAELAITINGLNFQFASEDLRNDKEFCKLATRNSYHCLNEYLGADMKRERNLILENVKKHTSFIPDEFKDDKEIVFESVSVYGGNIEQASFDLRNDDRELIRTAVRNGCPLSSLDNRIIDRDLVFESILYGSALCIVSVVEEWPEIVDEEKIIHFQILRGCWDWFKYFNPLLRNDKDFVRKYVKICGDILEYVSEDFKNDREIVKEAVSNSANAFKYASDTLKNDREIVEALKNAEESVYFISGLKDRELVLQAAEKGVILNTLEEFTYDREIALKTVSKAGSKLLYLSYDLRSDREIVLEAVKNDHSSLEYSMYDSRYDKDVILKADLPLSHVVPALRNDRELVLKLLEKPLKKYKYHFDIIDDTIELEYYSGSQFVYLSDELKEEFKSNKEIMLKAIKFGPTAINYASKELQNDEEFVLEAAQINGMVLNHVLPKFKHNRNVVMKAVQQNGMSLSHACNELQNDIEIVQNALKSHVCAFEYAGYKLRGDKEFVLEMTRQNYHAFKFASSDLQGDEDIISQVMEINIETLNCASYSLRNNVDFLKRMNKDNRLVERASFNLQRSINMQGLLDIEETDPKKYEKLLDFYIDRLVVATENSN
ncbi:predicted protein [Naegleria gruberi]|uniref:Predicted protein n=1 Tax=Naegleria gruberi TaxID=5762 RepID=D2W039_NAEGR|nr:uncharacterized protein NAEGRDRAFT_53642 [Naegleria gruberi]EFC37507.1 predicted protein [Naegleria gruberi]|eukprot:XP_002670251.1 predicted protein [Naegleria gruberi strain NEG-M]